MQQQSRRPTFTVLAIAAVLALGGCASSTNEPAQSTPEASASSPVATPSPTPTQTGPDLADPASWIVTFTGLGPIEVGATVESTVSVMSAFQPATQEACPWVMAYAADGLPSVWLPDPQSTGAVGQIVLQAWGGPTTVSASPKTAQGVGVGSTLEALRAAYPDLTEQQGKYAVFYAVTDGAGHWINFAVTDDLVDAIVVRDEARIDSEYCG